MTLPYHAPAPEVRRAACMRRLRWISAAHFFLGGMTGLAFLYVTLRVTVMPSGPGSSSLAEVGRVVAVFATLGAASFLFVFLGSALRRPAAYGACLAANAAIVLVFPVGTVLAGVTYWQLRRADVRELFRLGAA